MKMPRSEKQRKEMLGNIVMQELERAEGRDSDELQANRTRAMEYYRGAPLGNEKEGRSQIISMDVANTTNATLAMMREMLILDAELVVEPEGEEDEATAKAESDICSDVFLKDNPGERILLSAIKDGLLLKNGCIKIRMAEGELIAAAVPIENISYSAGYAGFFQSVPFFSERLIYTRSELVDMGLVSKAEAAALPAYSDYSTGTEHARNVTYKKEGDGETTDQDEIECHEAYLLTDMDGDGISERYRALIAGVNTCIDYETVELIPFAMGSPFLAPHRLTGESIFDRIFCIQDSNTKMLRQWHDNVAVVNNGRYIYDPDRVTEADIMEPKAGGGIRATDPTAVIPLVVQDITGGIQMAMDYNRQQRTEAVGAALDMASAQAQLANKAATVASIEKGNQELVSSMIASNYAITLVQSTYRIIHYFLRNFAEREYLTRVNGQIVSIDPTEWPAKRRMHVRCGMSPSQKAMQQQALMQHLQLQVQAVSQGKDNILANDQTLYRTSQRLLKSYGIEDTESLAVDPSSQAAQQAKQQQAQAAQQQQQQLQQMQAQMVQMQAQLDQAKLAEDKRQHDGEMRFKYYETDQQIEMDEAKLTAQGVIDLEKERMSNDRAGQAAPGQSA